MTKSAQLKGLAAAAGLIMAAAGCGERAVPGDELWPFRYADTPPSVAERLGQVDGPDGSYTFMSEVDGQPAQFIGSRNRQPVIIVYDTVGGGREQILLQPGQSVAVVDSVADIVAVMEP